MAACWPPRSEPQNSQKSCGRAGDAAYRALGGAIGEADALVIEEPRGGVRGKAAAVARVGEHLLAKGIRVTSLALSLAQPPQFSQQQHLLSRAIKSIDYLQGKRFNGA